MGWWDTFTNANQCLAFRQMTERKGIFLKSVVFQLSSVQNNLCQSGVCEWHPLTCSSFSSSTTDNHREEETTVSAGRNTLIGPSHSPSSGCRRLDLQQWVLPHAQLPLWPPVLARFSLLFPFRWHYAVVPCNHLLIRASMSWLILFPLLRTLFASFITWPICRCLWGHRLDLVFQKIFSIVFSSIYWLWRATLI